MNEYRSGYVNQWRHEQVAGLLRVFLSGNVSVDGRTWWVPFFSPLPSRLTSGPWELCRPSCRRRQLPNWSLWHARPDQGAPSRAPASRKTASHGSSHSQHWDPARPRISWMPACGRGKTGSLAPLLRAVCHGVLEPRWVGGPQCTGKIWGQPTECPTGAPIGLYGFATTLHHV